MAIAACSSNKNASNDGSEGMLGAGTGMDANGGNGNMSSEEQARLQMQQLQQNNIVYFDLDKYDIRSDFAQMLDAHANFLRSNPSYKVTVEGHADERGTPEYNISLGERRANAVKMYLQGKGVSADQISIVSYGKEKPAVNMAGWRIGFMVGNKTLVSALARIKSYHDYGTFTPLQVAAIAALEGDQQCVRDIAEQYKRRRDVLVKGLHEAGWMVEMPKASMYVWAKIPEPYAAMGSLEFAKKLLNEAKVCVSPGIGFGDYGDTHVRFALIENRDRIRQAIRGIKAMFRADGLLPASSKHIHENAE